MNIPSTESLKIVIIGSPGTGKSRMIRRLLNRYNTNNHSYETTLFLEIFKYQSASGTHYNIWDTAGKVVFGAGDDGIYHGAHMYIITGKPASFSKWYTWLQASPHYNRNAQIHSCNDANELKSILI